MQFLKIPLVLPSIARLSVLFFGLLTLSSQLVILASIVSLDPTENVFTIHTEAYWLDSSNYDKRGRVNRGFTLRVNNIEHTVKPLSIWEPLWKDNIVILGGTYQSLLQRARNLLLLPGDILMYPFDEYWTNITFSVSDTADPTSLVYLNATLSVLPVYGFDFDAKEVSSTSPGYSLSFQLHYS